MKGGRKKNLKILICYASLEKAIIKRDMICFFKYNYV